MNLKCLRDWIGDVPDRQPYMTWYTFYFDAASKAQEALATGDPKTEEEERERDRQKDLALKRAIAKTLPKPPR